MKLHELMERLGARLRESVDAMVAPLSQRITAMEARAPVPGPRGEVGVPGEPGPHGPEGPAGRDGADGVDGAPGAQGEAGPAGADGAAGPQGEVGPVGPPGESGQKGDSGPAGAAGANGAPGPRGEAGPTGAQGERGEPGERGLDGAPGARGEVGPAGERGLQGEPGPRGEVGGPGIVGKDGKDGRDGRDGENGRDALELNVLSGIDATKSYPRGTFAEFRGGLIRAQRATDPLGSSLDVSGWSVVLNGIAEETEEMLEDGRTLRRVTIYTNGRRTQRDFTSAVMVYRGVWREGQHEAGDVVTWAGSAWHCQRQTKAKPEDSDDWKLMVKRGRDGKDGSGNGAPPAASAGPVRLK